MSRRVESDLLMVLSLFGVSWLVGSSMVMGDESINGLERHDEGGYSGWR